MVVTNTAADERPYPARRVIILGASNVTLGLASLVGTAQVAWGGPLDIMAAIGFGRSYGLRSRLLGRSLPSILECRLWDDLANRPPAPTAALVTDIGNDILYGSDVPVILRWLHTCLERLQPLVERLVITRLPVANLDRFPDWQLRLLTSLLFPNSRLHLGQARENAHELDHQLVSFAGQYHAYVVQPDRHWYTWDPIHVTRSCRALAWQKYLFAWTNGEPLSRKNLPTGNWWKCFRARPQTRTVFGIARHHTQPCARFPNGTTLSLY